LYLIELTYIIVTRCKKATIKGDKIMNRVELVGKVAKESGLTRAQSDAAIEAFVNVVSESLKQGDKVSLKGFGTFEVNERKERTGRNPRTGETVTIKARKAPAFKVSSSLKKLVNE
jgi:DNA-binding protein HU-beta